MQSRCGYRGRPGSVQDGNDSTRNIRTFLTDMGQLPEYRKVRAARFTGTPPTMRGARATLESLA